MELAASVPLRTLASGRGQPVVLFHGYGMRPETYSGVARLIAQRGCRVLVPDLFSLSGRWSVDGCVSAAAQVLDGLGVASAVMIAHSFGGGVQLRLAVQRPDLVSSLVFTDTLALSREWTLAREALHPATLFRMATPAAAWSFLHSWLAHPTALARAAWWGFTSDRRHGVEIVGERPVATHVLWAERDSLLPRSEGLAFARDLGASFDVVRGRPGGGPVDHDFMFRHPALFVGQLDRLGTFDLAQRGHG